MTFAKILVIGDGHVGKTCLLLRFCDDKFTPSFMATIGIDFKMKHVRIKEKELVLQIWDTAGQERYKTITTAYYRGAMGILLVYDVSSERSFNNIRNWLKLVETHARKDVCLFLVGNKADMEDRVISEVQGRELATEFSLGFIETSAKTGENVQAVFEKLAANIVEKGLLTMGSSNKLLSPTVETKSNAFCC